MIVRFSAIVIFATLLPGLSQAEQYLKLKSGSKYLGRVSGADKKKFIFCDFKVGAIPIDAELEDTLERCGAVWTLDVPKYRLIAISEGASAENDFTLAKAALQTAERIQNGKDPLTDVQMKAEIDNIESRTHGRLKAYLDKGSAQFSTGVKNR